MCIKRRGLGSFIIILHQGTAQEHIILAISRITLYSIVMASISGSTSYHSVPDFQAYYGKEPVLNTSQTGIDSAGNYEETPKVKETVQEVAAAMDVYRQRMKSENYWSLDDPIARNMDNFIEKHLDGNIPRSGPKESIDIDDGVLIIDEKPRSSKDSGFLPPSEKEAESSKDTSYTGTTNSIRRVVDGVTSVLRKPYERVSRNYQRPRTLFEQSRKNANPMPVRETFYHMGNDKYVTVNNFRGRKTVHVRQFYMNANNERCPTKKGVTFTPEEWNQLTKCVKDVNGVLKS